MRVPVTDAFDDSDDFESLEVALTSNQLDWLRQKADERDLSLDHMLRSVITAQMRAQDDSEDTPPLPSASGDGQPTASPSADEDAMEDPPSIVDSLRSASKRLQNLTEQDDDAETPDPHDTLERLQARLGDTPDAEEDAEEADQPSFLVENKNRSMFDMVDDE